jgi:predicted DNA-binding protein (MmcQ/YjbR family)
MNVEDIHDYCLSLKGTTEGFPFGDSTLVFKVKGKIYALLNLDGDLSINLKCDPVKAIELREECPSVQPGYHMNKQHWNTVLIDGSVPAIRIKEWIDHSYELVGKRSKKQNGKMINN